MPERRAVLVSRHWRDQQSELGYVTRLIAGAASRCGPVSVLVPGASVAPEPDGAFDLTGLGEPGALRWPDGISVDHTIVVDDLTPEVVALLSALEPRAVLYLTAPSDEHPPSWTRLHLVDTGDGSTQPSVNVHIPVNRLAEQHRHHGFGFTGYQLVLSDRVGCGDADEPPAEAAWLSAAFHGADVLVVEDAVASAWRGRALRGRVTVDTRMDLWRLVAHANVCIDLGPGSYVARECVEALRFGTPIIVPECSGPAVVHAREGGGATFGDAGELVAAAAAMRNEGLRSAASAAGRRYADAHFGDAETLVERLRVLLSPD
jgi:hypothetical protein